MDWMLKESGFDKSKVEMNGNRFIIGNGYMGYRGTMEEYNKEHLVACNLAGVYDKVGNGWREPVNAPNAFFTTLSNNGTELNVFSENLIEHEQCLDISAAIYKRRSVYLLENGSKVTVQTERFLSINNVHNGYMKLSIICSEDCALELVIGIDGDVWDINGPHLKQLEKFEADDTITLKGISSECNHTIAVSESVSTSIPLMAINTSDDRILRKYKFNAKPGVEYTFTKYISVVTSLDGCGSPIDSSQKFSKESLVTGYSQLLLNHKNSWQQRWSDSDVAVEGDEEAQFALRYSIYHLLIIAPSHSGRISIPARGLSGQVYKGAIFWDTEMFMNQFFYLTQPRMARNLVSYRINTLDGARRKAQEYGFRGAFYAWESQETGGDACTDFAITDVFSGRPMRTYFRDKQVHISADVVYAIWQYYLCTRDESILLEGGAEVILECARFFYTYSYFSKEKNRYEILDVVGPDEYHDRVGNNAYTNKMVKHTLEVAIRVIDLFKSQYHKQYLELFDKLKFDKDYERILEMDKLLYVPSPAVDTGLIEQFDGYFKLKDEALHDLKSKIKIPNEYLGGCAGLATTTQIIKQADVITMLNIFKMQYSQEIKKANWEYYEPRTEHGSSLSACVYALVAADIGNPDWAYKYFMKTATIDLTADSKQYVGNLYIGGTHPAANGGAWMSAVLGFAGVNFTEEGITLNPALPKNWEKLSFNIQWRNQRFKAEIFTFVIKITAHMKNELDCIFKCGTSIVKCMPGSESFLEYQSGLCPQPNLNNQRFR